jgi:hypothetical protein
VIKELVYHRVKEEEERTGVVGGEEDLSQRFGNVEKCDQN